MLPQHQNTIFIHNYKVKYYDFGCRMYSEKWNKFVKIRVKVTTFDIMYWVI